MKRYRIFFIFVLLLTVRHASAQPTANADAATQPALELPWVLSSGMVVQRDQPMPVWGSADPGDDITVAFAGQTKRTTADAEGAWRIELDALPASARARAMTITAGGQTRVLTDVLVGEVWVCAGQSNMWWPLSSSIAGENAAARVAQSQTLRLLDPQPTVELGRSVWPLEDVLALTPERYFAVGRWSHGDSAAAGRFSAVGAFFGLYLQEHLDVPIGLIDVAVGGTPTEAWVPRDVVLANEATADLEENFLGSAHAQDFVRDRPLVHLRQWDQAGRPGETPEHPFRPGFLYDAAIAPLAGLPIAGVLWYQGESNAEDAEMHDALFTMAVASWRAAFGRDDLPVYWAQLPELNREMWPEFRESQQRLADSIPHTGMAVTIGLGHPTDVHPRDKGPVGERLARLALSQVYGKDIAYQGARYIRVFREGSELVLWHANMGLEIKPDPDAPHHGFWVAGEDRVFHPADRARAEANQLFVGSAAVETPSAIRYAWEANTTATLFNAEGLPAAPFRTDDWDTIRVACVGDSITFGSTINNPASNSYPSQLSRLVGPLFDVRNFGVPGASVVNGLIQPRSGWDRGYIGQMAYQRSAVFEPDLVIINLGINDVTNEAFDIDEFVADYTALIEAYRGLPSEPNVIIWHKLAPLFPGQAFYEHPRLALIQQALDRVVAETGVETLDMHTPLEGEADRFADKIHPDAQGAGIIADVTRDKLEAMGVPVAIESQPTESREEE
ncbi:GDSL-type esterase/lipase family protein [Phycisphaeraceae bacterium D3-23]